MGKLLSDVPTASAYPRPLASSCRDHPHQRPKLPTSIQGQAVRSGALRIRPCRASFAQHWINSCPRSRKGLILNQIFRPIQRFPQSLESVRIIAFAFFLDGGVSEAAYRGAQTLDRFVSNPEGFRQGMFQGFALGIERLLGRWWNRNVSGVGENQAESLQDIPSAQPALL